MHKALLDTTVLVSAFLKPVPEGPAFRLLALARDDAFELYLSDDILAETSDVLLNRKHLRKRYKYPDSAVDQFCKGLADLAVAVVSDPPPVQVVRDPNDNMIVACALAAARRRGAGGGVEPGRAAAGLQRDNQGEGRRRWRPTGEMCKVLRNDAVGELPPMHTRGGHLKVCALTHAKPDKKRTYRQATSLSRFFERLSGRNPSIAMAS